MPAYDLEPKIQDCPVRIIHHGGTDCRTIESSLSSHHQFYSWEWTISFLVIDLGSMTAI